jgi:Caspase domain
MNPLTIVKLLHYALGALALFSIQIAHAQTISGERVALVIGNSAYTAAAPLDNPRNDALAMSSLLQNAGFEVSSQVDTTLEQLQKAVTQFGQRIKDPKVKFAVFYYAGHGVQLDWRNYLVPVTAKIRTANDVRQQTVDVSNLITLMSEAKNRNYLIILDACRDDPFAGSYRTPAQGLSQFDAPSGSVLAYSTSPGRVAFDGEGINGLYTTHLLKELAVKGARIEDAFKRTRLNVRIASNGAQVPWETTSLEEDLYLFPDARKNLSEADQHALFEQELVAWGKIKNSTNLLALADFIRLYPSGSVSELAAAKLNRLQAAQRQREAQEAAAVQAAKLAALLAAEQERTRREVALKQAQQEAILAKQESDRKAELEAQKQAKEQSRLQTAQLQAEAARVAAAAAESARIVQAQALQAQQFAQAKSDAAKLALAKAQEQEAAAVQAAKSTALLAAEQERMRSEAAFKQAQQEALLAKQEADRTADRIAKAQAHEAQQLVQAKADAASAALVKAQAREAAELEKNKLALALAAAPAVAEPISTLVAATPYYKGSTEHLRSYSVGDVYEFQIIDSFTKATKPLVMQVTQLDTTNDTVQFNGGEYVSDVMGNILTNLRGSSSTPRQFYPAEIMVGKRWRTQFVQNRSGGIRYTFRYDIKVVGIERITVPAGTFDTYKIEARGFNMELGANLQRNIWIAPSINADIAHETIVRLKTGLIEQYDRQELVKFNQKTTPQKTIVASRY